MENNVKLQSVKFSQVQSWLGSCTATSCYSSCFLLEDRMQLLVVVQDSYYCTPALEKKISEYSCCAKQNLFLRCVI